MQVILTLIGFIALIPLLVIYSSFSWGYVASVIYGWFIIPTFQNAPHLTWIQLAGIMFLVNCFIHTGQITSYIKDESLDNTKGLSVSLTSPFLTLFGAWIFKLIFF